MRPRGGTQAITGPFEVRHFTGADVHSEEPSERAPIDRESQFILGRTGGRVPVSFIRAALFIGLCGARLQADTIPITGTGLGINFNIQGDGFSLYSGAQGGIDMGGAGQCYLGSVCNYTALGYAVSLRSGATVQGVQSDYVRGSLSYASSFVVPAGTQNFATFFGPLSVTGQFVVFDNSGRTPLFDVSIVGSGDMSAIAHLFMEPPIDALWFNQARYTFTGSASTSRVAPDTAIPEPAGFGLMLSGFAFLAYRARRKAGIS